MSDKLEKKIKVSVSKKCGDAHLSFGAEVEVPADRDMIEFQIEVYDRLAESFDAEYEKFAEKHVKKAFVNNFPPAQPQQQQAQPTGDLGKCQKCDAPMKLSKANKVYCSDLCWTK